MEFVERMKEKGRRAIFKNIGKEAAKAGSVELAEVLIVDTTGKTGESSAWKEIAAGFVGGHLSPDEVYVFQMVNEEVTHWLFYPVAKVTALPCEHHALIAGTIPASASLQHGSGSGGALNWHSQDARFAETLNQDPVLMKRCRKVSFKWHGMGVQVDHVRPLQVRNTGEGRIHVALRGGMYGFFNDKAGFSIVGDICRMLNTHIAEPEDVPEVPFLEPLGFTSAFMSAAAAN